METYKEDYTEFNYSWTPNIVRKLNTDFVLNIYDLQSWNDYTITNITANTIVMSVVNIQTSPVKIYNFIVRTNLADASNVNHITTLNADIIISAHTTIGVKKNSPNELIITY